MWGHKFNPTVGFLGLAGTASLLSGCYPGDEHSYMVWGAKDCESCPSDYEFRSIAGRHLGLRYGAHGGSERPKLRCELRPVPRPDIAARITIDPPSALVARRVGEIDRVLCAQRLATRALMARRASPAT